MKWIFLAGLLALFFPLSIWLRGNARHAPKVWALLGFLPLVTSPWNLAVAPIAWPLWPGYVRGVEVGLLDAVAIAILISRPAAGRHLPLKLPFIIYVLAAAASIALANVPMASSFYVWQLLRAYLLLAAVICVCDDERGPRAIVSGMVLGLAVHAGYAISDRLGGAVQTGGGLGHQNLLGFVSHFVSLPALALLLAGRRGWAPLLGPAAGIVTAILGASRATIGLAGAGLAALVLIGSVRRPSTRKTLVACGGLVALALAAPLAIQALERRYAELPPAGEYDERAAFEEAARSMIADHPFGVGANNYVVVANTQGYSDKAGVIWTSGSRSAHVHNSYLLIAAETGYLGLIAFLAMLIRSMQVAFLAAFRSRNSDDADLLLGLGMALLVVSAHALFEWAFLMFDAQAMLFLNFGLIYGVARQLGYWGRPAEAVSRMPRSHSPPAPIADYQGEIIGATAGAPRTEGAESCGAVKAPLESETRLPRPVLA